MLVKTVKYRRADGNQNALKVKVELNPLLLLDVLIENNKTGAPTNVMKWNFQFTTANKSNKNTGFGLSYL